MGIHTQTKEHASKNNENSILDSGITKKVMPMVYYAFWACGVSYKTVANKYKPVYSLMKDLKIKLIKQLLKTQHTLT